MNHPATPQKSPLSTDARGPQGHREGVLRARTGSGGEVGRRKENFTMTTIPTTNEPPSRRDFCVYFGTVAAGWVLLFIPLHGVAAPLLKIKDEWWHWVLAAPLMMGAFIALTLGFFGWLIHWNTADSRINAMVRRIISSRWPEREAVLLKAWFWFKMLLFMPWFLCLLF